MIAQTTAALTRLKPVCIDKSIYLSSKIRLMRSLVTSIFLYTCESWTLTTKLQGRIQAMEMRCYRRHYTFHTKTMLPTRKTICAKLQQAIGPLEDLTIVTRRKLQWYGHVSRSLGLAKTILQDTVKGGRRQGRQRKRWEDNNGSQDVKYLVNSILPLVYVDGGFASLHRQDRQPCLTPV